LQQQKHCNSRKDGNSSQQYGRDTNNIAPFFIKITISNNNKQCWGTGTGTGTVGTVAF
jgi:hypothetical protein